MATIDKLFDTFREALASKERDMVEAQQAGTLTKEQSARIASTRDKLEKAQSLRQQFNAEMADILVQADLLAYTAKKSADAQYGHLLEKQELLADDINHLADLVTLLTPQNFIHVLKSSPLLAIELFSYITNDPTLTSRAVGRLTNEQMTTLRQNVNHDAKRRWGNENEI